MCAASSRPGPIEPDTARHGSDIGIALARPLSAQIVASTLPIVVQPETPDKSSELKRGYYLLFTDAGMKSSGRKRAGEAPGEAAIGAVLKTPRLALLDRVSKRIGRASHNAAEYSAVIEGLKLAQDHSIRRLRVYLDSELVVEQLNEHSKVREPGLMELYQEARAAAARFTTVRFCWIPREMNKEADRLAREALGQ